LALGIAITGFCFDFDEADWSSISEDPGPFINAQWSPDEVKTTQFQPWHQYELKAGRPF
jgi:hypothetical protein